MPMSKKLAHEIAMETLVEQLGGKQALAVLDSAIEKATKGKASKSVLESLRRLREATAKLPK